MCVHRGYFPINPLLLLQYCWNHNRTTLFFFFGAFLAQAVLFALWERSHSIFSLPVLPLSHLHTSEPYCTLHKLELHMHLSRTGKKKKKKKHNPCLSACIPLKSLTLTAVYIYTHMAASHKLRRWDNQILLSVVVVFLGFFFALSAKQESKALSSQPCRASSAELS